MRIKNLQASPHTDDCCSGRCSYFHNFMVGHESHLSDGEVKIKASGARWAHSNVEQIEKLNGRIRGGNRGERGSGLRVF